MWCIGGRLASPTGLRVVRQVSFTLLLTQSRRNGNPAQYERNHRFRHLVETFDLEICPHSDGHFSRMSIDAGLAVMSLVGMLLKKTKSTNAGFD
ncbi:hypothetical protein DPMN_158120 [Dreissena polymorpha]|uniref:Uncharacterized protein n=1 Tax=Dreissena polymorpha TaxID=45954 RepID=A0A9D4IPH3_DREPO|nr:hypothetical protein DPMN_158120 [Dreissena polymorpha]